MNFLHFFTLEIISTLKKKNDKKWYLATQIINIMPNPGIKMPLRGRRLARHTRKKCIYVVNNVEREVPPRFSMSPILRFHIINVSDIVIKLIN